MRLYKVFSLLEFLIFLFFIVLALSLLFFYFNNSSLNNKGVKALKSRDFLRAKKYFSQNVESGFSDHRSYLNLALSYDLLKQPLKALEIYNIVSSSNNRSKDVFFSYFNQAELYGRMEKLEKALKNYQSALEFRQKEKEIKTNIELLFKQKNQKEQKENKPADSKNSENQKQSNRLNDSQSKKDKNKNQSSGDKSQSGESSVKNQEKEDQKQGGEEEQNKSKDGHSEENKDKGQSEKNPSHCQRC